MTDLTTSSLYLNTSSMTNSPTDSLFVDINQDGRLDLLVCSAAHPTYGTVTLVHTATYPCPHTRAVTCPYPYTHSLTVTCPYSARRVMKRIASIVPFPTPGGCLFYIGAVANTTGYKFVLTPVTGLDPTQYKTTSVVNALVCDFDADGDLDLFIVTNASASLLENTAGIFALPSYSVAATYPVSQPGMGAMMADVDAGAVLATWMCVPFPVFFVQSGVFSSSFCYLGCACAG